jgi:HTH-type transcriptional regulator/antitoxin HipB
MSVSVDDLADLVRFHRRKSGVTQQQLAQLAGVGKTVVFDIEHGKATVQLATLLRVLEALNIRIAFHSPLMDAWRGQRRTQ